MYPKSANTISNIFEAAQSLFVSKNYADVTMAEIAEAAQVTKGALYHHFAGKETLYQEMMLADLQEKQALMQSAAQSEGTCRERLYRLTLCFLDLPSEKQVMMKLVRRDINIFRDPTRHKLIRAYQAALPEQVETIIKDGIRDDELSSADSRLLSWTYVALVEVVLSGYARDVLGDNHLIANYVLTLFFNGAQAKAAA